ncbi:hypothetical protein TRFO_27229 [Tritrichomonas foetus]|uniref:Uncharacterized protein n=1 Tax=Tritrichomonas foetus TaxID=1144522 RepID=A0A1J4K6S5_9EUKA|nr:hypothetical protein TRFO_27229 [Tritrichomonas foetus]|eukprot:OHT05157.1 hypothetical protein TRFO_27229 [Tritrichomonas foetus]
MISSCTANQPDYSPWESEYMNDIQHGVFNNGPPSSVVQSISPYIPDNVSLFQKLQIPLGIVIDPLPDTPIKKLSYSGKCRKCGAYSTPFHERSNICPFCLKTQSVFFHPVSEYIYDCLAPESSVHLKESGPRILFLIHNTFYEQNSTENNFNLVFIETLEAILNEFPDRKDDNFEFGLILFDSTIQIFLPYKNTLTVLSDLSSEIPVFDKDKVFTTNVNSITKILKESKKRMKTSGNCFYEALEIGRKILDKKGGIILASCLGRPDLLMKIYSKEKIETNELLKIPQNEIGNKITKIANDCHISGISLELFLSPKSGKSFNINNNNNNNIRDKNELNKVEFVNSTFLGVTCCLTGGSLHFFHPNLNIKEKLRVELINFLKTDCVFDVFASFKFRKKEIQISKIYENAIHHHKFSYFPVFQKGKTFSLELSVKKLVQNGFGEIIFLFTNSKRERIVRVISFRLLPTNLIENVINFTNPIILGCIFLKNICRFIMNTNFQAGFHYFNQLYTKIYNELSKKTHKFIFEKLCSSLKSSFLFLNSSTTTLNVDLINDTNITASSLDSIITFLINVRPMNLIDSTLFLYPRKLYSKGNFLVIIHYYDKVLMINEDNERKEFLIHDSFQLSKKELPVYHIDIMNVNQ